MPSSSSSSNSSNSLPAFLNAFWKFLRPHTIRGTVLGSLAVTARSLLEQGAPLASLDWAGLAPRAALGVLALLAGNGFIVGINQIYDVEIDVVNKPFLPVAAGELSPKAAWVLVTGLAIAGVALSWGVFGKEIGMLYAFGLTLGAVYSVPPFRLKTKPVPAFLIIATVRGFLLNYGVYSAVRAALGLQFIWSPAMVREERSFFFFFFQGRESEKGKNSPFPSVSLSPSLQTNPPPTNQPLQAFITAFVTTFAVAIAVTKDLADVEGDRAFGVSTFATRLGVENVATLGTGLLLANYAGAIGMALAAPGAFFRPTFAAAAHAFLAAALLASAKALSNAKYSKEAVADFYRRIWSLFYAEYALFAFL